MILIGSRAKLKHVLFRISGNLHLLIGVFVAAEAEVAVSAPLSA